MNSPPPATRPVIFFNASTRLSGLSLNGGFSLLSAWALRLAGTPVHHFVCRRGMKRCILGTDRRQPQNSPPCHECIVQSQALYSSVDVNWFEYFEDTGLSNRLEDLGLEEMSNFEYADLPLGSLVLPSLRWILRRYHLVDDEDTRFLFRSYILSAWSIAEAFTKMIEQVKPQAVVVFNGIVFPEAVVRHISRQQGIRTITHEVNLLPFSAYFTNLEATFRTVDIPPGFNLSPAQESRLDSYLEERFQGNFTMAGVRFWPQIRGLGEDFLKKASSFQHIVPVFTNVIFDTTQDHANTVFLHMFDWLDQVMQFIYAHPDTLFVLRAHPDETRPGKESQESVAEWAIRNNISSLPNVYFVDANEYLNSYQLIQRSRLVMVYTSTIGLEASLLGVPVLMGGSARFNMPDLPTAYFPATPADYFAKAESLLTAQEIELPPEYKKNARKYLYYEIFRAALPFEAYIKEDDVWQGYVTLRSFPWQTLLPQNSITMRTVVNGILHEQPFLLPE